MKLLVLAFVILGISDLTLSKVATCDVCYIGDLDKVTTEFAIKLFGAVGKEEKGNLFMSPLSLQILLALIYTGARGNTAKELAPLVFTPEFIEQLFQGYSGLIKDLQTPMAAFANKLYVDITSPLKEDFQTNAENYFLSKVESLDFQGAPDVSRKYINSWVEFKTYNKIKDLLAPGTITALTKLVLANAIYFKAQWLYRFNVTEKEPFRLSSTENKTVNMMRLEGGLEVYDDDTLQATIVKLKYENQDFKMYVILPYEVDGLSALEDKLGKVNLFEKLKKSTRLENTILKMPEFKMETTLQLENTLKSLGVKSMFTKNADLSGISETPLAVSVVVQKAFVHVNSNGTEAAAATSTTIESRKIQPRRVFVDRPFIFLISYNTFPLFIGRVTEPKV